MREAQYLAHYNLQKNHVNCTQCDIILKKKRYKYKKDIYIKKYLVHFLLIFEKKLHYRISI